MIVRVQTYVIVETIINYHELSWPFERAFTTIMADFKGLFILCGVFIREISAGPVDQDESRNTTKMVEHKLVLFATLTSSGIVALWTLVTQPIKLIRILLRYQPSHRGRLRADRSSALCFNTLIFFENWIILKQLFAKMEVNIRIMVEIYRAAMRITSWLQIISFKKYKTSMRLTILVSLWLIILVFFCLQ